MKRNKFFFIIVVLSAIMLITISYIHQNYLFNPLTFKRSDMIPLKWKAYKLPMDIEYFVINEEAGWIYSDRISDVSEIRKVYSLLITARKTEESPKGYKYGFTVRSNGEVLHQFVGIEGCKCISPFSNNYYEIPIELYELIHKRVKESS